MGKEKPVDPEKAARKAEKKARKEKRSEKDGIHKSSSSSSISRKDKDKDKDKDKKQHGLGQSVENKDKDEDVSKLVSRPAELDQENIIDNAKLIDSVALTNPGSVAVKHDNGEMEISIKSSGPITGALVPFANPLADDKLSKKVFKGVKKANKNAALKRGVKEVVKALRKSPVPGPSSSGTPVGIIVLAADISPMDVISHIPVLCEDHGIPYIFVTSRLELGAAGNTKRPTSVVLINATAGKKRKVKSASADVESKTEDEKKEKNKGAHEEDDWETIYLDLIKAVQKAGRGVRI